MSCSIVDRIPEELLERILNYDSRMTPLLLVSKQFYRIYIPILYSSITLPSTLTIRPDFALHVTQLTLRSISHQATTFIRLCPNIHTLDLTIAFDDDDDDHDDDDDAFISSLFTLTHLRHLSLHKPSRLYLSLPRPRALIRSLSQAIKNWPLLQSVFVAFKLSDDSPTSPGGAAELAFPNSPGPISLLTSSLANAPSLHTFTTHLPSVWNTAIPAVAANPNLKRIVLLSPNNSSAHTAAAIIPTGLFFREARRHPRLADLIAAGTPILNLRSRAHTMGAYSDPPPPPPPTTKKPLGLGLKIDTTSLHRVNSTWSAGANSAINPSWLGSPIVRCGSSNKTSRF